MTCKTCGAPTRTEYCSLKCAEADKPKKTAAQLDMAVQEREYLKTEVIDYLKQETGLDFAAEYRFDSRRKWRFDFAFDCMGDCYPVCGIGEKCHSSGRIKIAIELEGVCYNRKSGHRTESGRLRDMEKHNAATTQGWTVLYYTTYEQHGNEARWWRNAAASDVKKLLGMVM